MPKERRRVYWDAPVWLSYINGEEDRLPTLDAILADSSSSSGTVELCTSILSQVEVAYAKSEQDKKLPDPEIEGNIDQLWSDRTTLKLIDFHDTINREARRLIRMSLTNGWSLKPMDAIHLASAKWFQALEFQTYDTHLLKYSNALEIPIVLPHVLQSHMGI